MKNTIIVTAVVSLILNLLSRPAAMAQGDTGLTETEMLYKHTPQQELKLRVISPAGTSPEPRPAIVFFFGGGWNGGSTGQFEPFAKYLAGRGMVAVLADYRTKNSADTTPLSSVEDARSAMRYVRANAPTLGIDPSRIAASGGSAGGHLAAAAAYVTRFDDPRDDRSVSAAPDALVLFNPVIDNSEHGYGYERLKDSWQDFSPMHNITPQNVRPTLFMIGSKDHLIPVETAERYAALTRGAGARCDLEIYEGASHGFFNHGRKKEDKNYYEITLERMEQFLVSIGYLEK